MIFVGIDPGITGAIAWLDEHGALLRVMSMPVVEVQVGKRHRKQQVPAMLAALFDAPHRPDKVYLEEVGVRPMEGAVGAFSFGRGVGQIEGVLAAMEIPFFPVTPGTWKKALGLPADKDVTVMRAIKTWPGCVSMFTPIRGERTAEHVKGIADAAMIGLYGTGVAS